MVFSSSLGRVLLVPSVRRTRPARRLSGRDQTLIPCSSRLLGAGAPATFFTRSVAGAPAPPYADNRSLFSPPLAARGSVTTKRVGPSGLDSCRTSPPFCLANCHAVERPRP